MRSNLQVRRPQTSMKEQDCHRVQVLGLLSFPVIGLKDWVISTTSNTGNALLFSAVSACYRYFKAGTLIGRNQLSMRYSIFYSMSNFT